MNRSSGRHLHETTETTAVNCTTDYDYDGLKPLISENIRTVALLCPTAYDDPVNNVDPTGEFTDAISFNSSAAIGIGLVGLTAAAVVEAKTHAIGNLMVATGQAGAELLDGHWVNP